MTADPEVLVGRWSLERRLADRLTGQYGRMSGLLSVTHDGAGLSWSESGTLLLGGRELPAYRMLGVRYLEGAWWMTFADGSPFHPWTPGQPVVHPCRADLYRGMVDLDATATVGRTFWDVVGPAKSQRIFTRYRRIPDDLSGPSATVTSDAGPAAPATSDDR